MRISDWSSDVCSSDLTLHVEARHTPRWLTMNFDDDGPGIPLRAREDVFKPFYRLDEARNIDDSGTGPGLSIVRDIARAPGGNVTLGEIGRAACRERVCKYVSNSVGRGSCKKKK